MSEHHSKDSFNHPNNSTNYLAPAPNAAQIIQQVLNNPLLQQQQQQQSLMNNPNAMASFFANSLAAFQAVQQQQQQQQSTTTQFPAFDPTALFNQMAMLSSMAANNAQQQQPPAALFGATEDTTLPTYVNPKQYARILKRRDARRIMDEYFSNKRKKREQNKPYMHESRHKHAMKRPRGPGGRFLTKEELEGLKQDDDDDEFEDYNNKDELHLGDGESSSSASEKKTSKTLS